MPRPAIDDSMALISLPDVRFGEAHGRALLLNAVFPRGDPQQPRPAVIFIDLAGWYESSREDGWFSPYLATHGFFAANIDVRVRGEATFPAQLHDVKAAVRWLRANAARTVSTPNASASGARRPGPTSRRWPGSPATCQNWKAIPARRDTPAGCRRWRGAAAPPISCIQAANCATTSTAR